MNQSHYFLSLLLFFTIISCEDKKELIAKANTAIFDDNFVHEIRIIPNSENFVDSLRNDKLNKKLHDVTSYRSCDIKIDGTLLKNAGIRYKGESSYNFQKNDKKSFKINLAKFDKKGKYQSIKRFALNNQFRDPTFMREKLMLELIRTENLPASRCSYAKVFFKNEYLGLYLLVEDIDKQFLQRNFKSKKGNLYNGKPRAFLTLTNDSTNQIEKSYRRKTNKSSKKYKDLENLIKVINSKSEGENHKKDLDLVFDTESCLKLWAINSLFMNVDNYNMDFPHNYMLYFKKEIKNGVKTKMAYWIGYDYNYSFGSWSRTLTLEKMINYDIFTRSKPTSQYPLSEKLLGEKSAYRKFYASYFKELIRKKLKSGWLDKEIDKNYTLIRDFVYEDNNKMTNNNDFELNIEESIGNIFDPGAFHPGLRSFIKKRSENIENQINKFNGIP